MNNLDQALVIVVVGITGVFVNLLVLMLVVVAIGKIFGEKQKKKATN